MKKLFVFILFWALAVGYHQKEAEEIAEREIADETAQDSISAKPAGSLGTLSTEQISLDSVQMKAM